MRNDKSTRNRTCDDLGMFDQDLPLRVTFDDEVDAAYISLKHPLSSGEAVRQICVDGGDDPWDVIIDVDANGRILGLEVLGASERLPLDLLRQF